LNQNIAMGLVTKKEIRLKSAIWDNLYYLFDEFSDRCIRAEIQFDGELDFDVLVMAFNKSIDLIPIIKSKWVTGTFNNHWEVIRNFDIRDYITVTDDSEVAENFILGKIDDVKAGAQIKVLLYKHDGKDSICVLFNHMCFDISVKDFFRLLSRYYSGLKQNKEFIVTDFIDGDREFWQVFKNFSRKQRWQFTSKKSLGMKSYNKLGFPYENGVPATEKVILKSSYDETFLQKLKDKSKKSGVTLNELFISALGRAILDICPDSTLPLEIHCAVNLRRYIKGGRTAGLTNMISGISVPIMKVKGESFEETVARVHELMSKFKSEHACMYGLELLRGVSLKLKVPFLRKKLVKCAFGNPMIGYSDAGSTTEDMVTYTGLNVEDFYILGAIKRPPYSFLTLYSFFNRLYVFIPMIGSKKDVETGKQKLDLMKSYLRSYIE